MSPVTYYQPSVPPELEAEYRRIDTKVQDILRDYMEIVGKRPSSSISYPKASSKPYAYYWKVGEDQYSVQVYLYVNKPKGLLGRLGNHEDPHLHVLFSEGTPQGVDVLGRILSRETGLPVKVSYDTLYYDDETNQKAKVQAEFHPDDAA